MIRSQIVEGHNAILENLPHPSVQMIDAHGYIPLQDVIADVLAHGIPTDVIPECEQQDVVHSLGQSRMATAIRSRASFSLIERHPVLPIWINEWSDDFDPNRSTKSNRASVWMKTISIGWPSNAKHKYRYSYPIAVGRKSDSHEAVEEQFRKDLLGLKARNAPLFYHKLANGMVKVHVEILAALQDQPERRSLNHISMGNGRYTARMGWVADWVPLADGLPSCKACFETRAAGLELAAMGGCNDCADWNYDSINGLLYFDPPRKYPQSEMPYSGLLKPSRISYESLNTAVRKAHGKVVSSKWTLAEAQAFLLVNGLLADSIRDFQVHAMNSKLFKEAMEEPERYAQVLADEKETPDLYRMWETPATWRRGTQLYQHVDTIMHLVFLGVTKTVAMMIQDWAKGRSKGTAFLKFADGVLEGVQCLNLSWCKVLPYSGGKLGGWVSENYLAFARLLKWFYSQLNVLETETEYVQPTKGLVRWHKKELVEWLDRRGLDKSGKVSEVRFRVMLFMDQDGGPPPLLPPKGGSVDHVMLTVRTLNCMVARLMCNVVDKDHIADTERLIKLFLSIFDRFDEGMREALEKKPKWASSYNFLCLLNLPEVMYNYGPLRNLWEGGHQGEGILRFVKSELNMGLRKGWQKSLLVRMLRTKALEEIMISKKSPIMDEEIIDTSSFFRYKDLGALLRKFCQGEPLSVIRLRSGEYGCAVYGKRLVPVQRKEFIEEVNGSCYHQWAMATAQGEMNLQEYNYEDVASYHLFLPKLGAGDTGKTFTVIDSEWREIDADGNFEMPILTGVSL